MNLINYVSKSANAETAEPSVFKILMPSDKTPIYHFCRD
ncbi:hypothetical protein PL10110_1090018 [Planktothrix agardhii]|nr:hypothetical protein PL10110_1090018 [Planktothrix agardhii]